jgi:hypothetical protein
MMPTVPNSTVALTMSARTEESLPKRVEITDNLLIQTGEKDGLICSDAQLADKSSQDGVHEHFVLEVVTQAEAGEEIKVVAVCAHLWSRTYVRCVEVVVGEDLAVKDPIMPACWHIELVSASMQFA